jgi:hypothetical protein
MVNMGQQAQGRVSLQKMLFSMLLLLLVVGSCCCASKALSKSSIGHFDSYLEHGTSVLYRTEYAGAEVFATS